MAKVWGGAIGAVVIILAFLMLTGTGHVVDLAVQHFMLFYAGVFALIGLCASVGAGFIATDRIILNPGHRVWVQAAHRAISFGALAFLIIHIVTEILAQRAHVIDAVVPFLSPFRTFYIGLGTIASDLIILLVITSIFRKRFTRHGKSVWRWRVIHYSSYAALVFGVWHGLLGGRPGKPYVDWSYGFVIAFVALGLAVRVLANSLRPRETLSAPPVADSAASGSAPLRAAAMLAQLGTARAMAPATALGGPARMLPEAGPMLPEASPAPAPGRVIRALPAGSSSTIVEDVPVYEDYGPSYDPGYPVPRSTISGPLPRASSGPMPQAPDRMPQAPGRRTGGFRGPGAGAMPGPATGTMPARPATGAMPRVPGEFRRPDAEDPRRVPGRRPARPAPRVPGRAPGPRPHPRFSGGDDLR